MARIKELIKSPHIHISLVNGFSIIVLVYFSKRGLPEPIGCLPLALLLFITAIYESVLGKYKDSRICTTRYCILAILAATVLVI